ncbi:MAG: trypsin-like peptidase domain-containing protein [Rhodobacterales bacterium]|nr:trypsin-like peptidase domain-containing protein [Rhodobacterales bacterium]
MIIRSDGSGEKIAVLASAQRSSVWLPIDADAKPLLGETIFALGFPYTDIFPEQGLSVTGGNESALPQLNDATAWVMFSAPVQPGNSGGPLLSESGEVLGVVVSRASDSCVLEQTGTLPQSMNSAVPTQQLNDFLTEQKVLLPTRASGGFRLDEGVPQEVQDSVVTVLCS